MLSALDEHQLLVFWTQIFLLLVTARLLGTAMRRLGQPTIVGELLAGLLLGPSVFGRIWPSGFEWFLPDDEIQSAMLLAVGWIGLAMILVVTGFETDLGLIRRLGGAAATVSVGSLVVPFVGGLVVGFIVPSVFVGPGTESGPLPRAVFALFLAAALSVSSLAVVAKILSELGFMRRNFAQLTVAVGMVNDVVGWLMLGLIAGLATSGEVSVGGAALTLGGMILFLFLALTVGQRLVDWLLLRVRREGQNVGGAMTIVGFVAFGFGVLTQFIGVEAVLGAFVAGVVLGRSRFHQEAVFEHLQSVTVAIFAPLFFATAGLRVDLGVLADGDALLWTIVIMVVALVAKFAGSALGALAARLHAREAVALGAGLNARGALEIVIATVGLGVGVFSDVAYTAVVLVPIVASLVASAVVRATVRNWLGSAEEQERLGREAALSRNIVVRSERLLLPSRGGPDSIAAAQILHFAWPSETGVTVLTVGSQDDPPDLEPVLNVLHDRDVERKAVGGRDGVAKAILAESKLGFGAIGIGASEVRPEADRFFSPVIAEVLDGADVPVVIVRRARNLEGPLPAAFSRALVPVAGTDQSRAAQEIAFNISAQLGTDIVLNHIVNRPMSGGPPESRPIEEVMAPSPRLRIRQDEDSEVARKVVDQAVDLAEEMGVQTRTYIRGGVSAAEEILAVGDTVHADLIVMGASLRRLHERAFLGHSAEHILEHYDGTVVVVVVPPGATG